MQRNNLQEQQSSFRAKFQTKKFQQFKKKLPINLQRKAIRERRYENELADKKKKPRKVKKRKPDFESAETDAISGATELELQNILENNEWLSEIPYDCTPEELLGEIALAKGRATTVYVKRDGLSTLTVVLPQKNPTIANLKRAIESTARVQLKRELRQRNEERLLRRRQAEATTITTIETTIASEEHHNSDNDNERQPQPSQQQLVTADSVSASQTTLLEPIKSTGELVYSTTRSGHHHRPNVSWRFLWRAYALFNVDTNLPLNDQNGRKLLSECGIENATTLKFSNREKYFGRKRQS